MHYYKFNIHDWQSSTRHLTPEEEGVYFRLINYYYDTEKPIPLETQPVIRRLMLGNHVGLVEQILDEFFVKTDLGYEKEKCKEVLKEYKKTAKKNKVNGAKGGRPRKHAASSESQSKPSGFSMGTQMEPTGNPNQEPLTKNHKPLKDNDQPSTDQLFDLFWSAGMRKTAKKDASKVFAKLIATKRQKQEFTDYLINDIQWRLANQQLGFTEMHPTTYLRNERWTDERRQRAAKSNGSKLSLAGRAEEQTRILQARIAAGDFDQRPVGQDDAAISPQMDFSGGRQDEREPAIDGEFYSMVPQDGGPNR